MKTTTDAVVVSGEVVYLYKLDKSGKSALISNVPALSDSTKRFLGWVPADLLAEVGQNEVYHIDYSRYRDSLLCAVNLMYPDTLALHNANIQGTMLFNLDGNPAGSITNGNIRLNYPCPSGTRTGIRLSISKAETSWFPMSERWKRKTKT